MNKAFAIPPDKFPIHTRRHAKASLKQVHQIGSDKDKVLVKAAIHRKFPDLHAFSFKPSADQAPAQSTATDDMDNGAVNS